MVRITMITIIGTNNNNKNDIFYTRVHEQKLSIIPPGYKYPRPCNLVRIFGSFVVPGSEFRRVSKRNLYLHTFIQRNAFRIEFEFFFSITKKYHFYYYIIANIVRHNFCSRISTFVKKNNSCTINTAITSTSLSWNLNTRWRNILKERISSSILSIRILRK